MEEGPERKEIVATSDKRDSKTNRIDKNKKMLGQKKSIGVSHSAAAVLHGFCMQIEDYNVETT